MIKHKNKKTTAKQWAYIAGIFDGEGSVGIGLYKQFLLECWKFYTSRKFKSIKLK